VLTDEGFTNANVEQTSAIDIVDFVNEEESIHAILKSPIILNLVKVATNLMFCFAKH
jgi:non-homologous end joining protein Ku